MYVSRTEREHQLWSQGLIGHIAMAGQTIPAPRREIVSFAASARLPHSGSPLKEVTRENVTP